VEDFEFNKSKYMEHLKAFLEAIVWHNNEKTLVFEVHDSSFIELGPMTKNLTLKTNIFS
jgi:hypothetical protein